MKFDGDGDFLAGAQVGDGGGEDVGPLLFNQGGPAPGAFRRRIKAPRLGPFLDDALDDAPADGHLQTVDGAVRRQGISIDGFGPARRGVAKVVGDGKARDQTRNLDLDIRAKQRHGPHPDIAVFIVSPVIPGRQKQAAQVHGRSRHNCRTPGRTISPRR